MPRVPDRQARDLDRLARRAHRFHRFAHHPLCAAYARETLRVGPVYLCKGCTFVAVGALLGAAAAALAPAVPVWAVGGSLALGTALGLAGLGGVRLGKILGRLALAGALAFAAYQGLRRFDVAGLALSGTALAVVLAGVAGYRRRGPFREPCARCPDRHAAPCPGFRRQYESELEFQRVAGSRLEA